MNLGGPNGITMSNGPNGTQMSMGGRNGISMSSGPGGNDMPGTMVGWNNNINSGNINGWPAQIGWNNLNNVGINSPSGLVNGRSPYGRNSSTIGFNNINNSFNNGLIGSRNINSLINSPSGLVNGRSPYGRNNMIGFNNINNVGNNIGVGNIAGGRVNGRYPNYPNHPMVGVNNNINIGNAGYDQAMEMADAMIGMGNININNRGWPGSSKKKKKRGWWRKK